MKKLLMALVLASMLSTAGAQTLRVVLWYEALPGLPEETGKNLSEAVIQGVLDACFELGLIGTNDRPVSGSLEAFLNHKPGAESAEGFVDYELAIFADFKGGGLTYRAPDCSYRLMRVGDQATRFEASLAAFPGKSPADAHIDEACMLMGAQMLRISLQGR